MVFASRVDDHDIYLQSVLYYDSLQLGCLQPQMMPHGILLWNFKPLGSPAVPISEKEEIMSVKIVIERKFKEEIDPATLDILDEIRMKALKSRGYIGGETIVNVEDSREVIVLSAWSSVDDWKTWYEKKEWKTLEADISPKLAEPAKIRAFMPKADFQKVS